MAFACGVWSDLTRPLKPAFRDAVSLQISRRRPLPPRLQPPPRPSSPASPASAAPSRRQIRSRSRLRIDLMLCYWMLAPRHLPLQISRIRCPWLCPPDLPIGLLRSPVRQVSCKPVPAVSLQIEPRQLVQQAQPLRSVCTDILPHRSSPQAAACKSARGIQPPPMQATCLVASGGPRSCCCVDTALHGFVTHCLHGCVLSLVRLSSCYPVLLAYMLAGAFL